MTTLAQLKALARAELGDTSGAPLWPEERLTAWSCEAIREYGIALPRQASVDIPAVAGQAQYTLPADCVRVVGVEHAGRAYALGGIGAVHQDGGAFGVYGRQLVLLPAPASAADPITVRYAATYAAPAADGDTLVTPPEDDELLVLGIVIRALRWLQTAEAKNGRYVRSAAQGRAQTGHNGATVLAGGYEHALREALARRRQGAASVRVSRLAALGP